MTACVLRGTEVNRVRTGDDDKRAVWKIQARGRHRHRYMQNLLEPVFDPRTLQKSCCER